MQTFQDIKIVTPEPRDNGERIAGAVFGEVDGKLLYRFELTRSWNPFGNTVNFIALNPSTADVDTDDMTTRCCINFAKAWGFGRMVLTNLYAWRARHPSELAQVEDPVGEPNDAFILKNAGPAHLVVLAWGVGGAKRGKHVQDLLRSQNITPMAFRLTKEGHPEHPLYLPSHLKLTRMSINQEQPT